MTDAHDDMVESWLARIDARLVVIGDRLSSLEGKVGAANAQVQLHFADDRAGFSNHADRLIVLETWQAKNDGARNTNRGWIAGIAAIAGTASGAAISAILGNIGGHK